ncbi:hypothetical protein DMP06_04225 [Slackia equolifaciens]|uniref:Ferric oxidoreductase domain-containing protein n=1 Tax=Slackia equolifaciens TaxID=498718 RepID=A0A3N0B0D2_9ACTN|nr:ferric reductase-like transmembrane domain-containing protein [Slackia equolifaciens]RNL40582.1 hypothetical protein DMP06_04225 [Slackia equolifaciens]
MAFLAILAGSAGAVFALRNPIHRAPALFYALAVCVDALFIFGDSLGLPRLVSQGLFAAVHKCTLALALFVIVMFIGVFSRESRVRRWLQPIRAELSVIAWILSLGHMAVYLSSYATRLISGNVNGAVLVALIVALVLFALLLILGITSFKLVKRYMQAETWKRVQSLAYVFFGLVYAHLMLMLLPPALKGGEAAQVSVAIYSVVFIGYGAARLFRALRDSKTHAEQ